MDLILWRHAEAEAKAEGEGEAGAAPDMTEDLARELTKKGERQAKAMARWLDQRLAASTRVLVSPAQRTLQTAAALGRKIQIVEAIGPDASAVELLRAAGWPNAAEPVLIVGHQPTLGQLAARLLSGHEHDWAIKKGAVWWFRSNKQTGELMLRAVQGPDCL